MSTQRRDLDNARDFGRLLGRTHLLQSANAEIAIDDIIPILDVSEVYEVAQAKHATVSGLYNGIRQLIAANPSSLPRYYGAFSSTETQTNVSGVNIMSANTTDIPDGVIIVNKTRFTPQASGVYNLQFSAQIEKDAAVDRTIGIFLRKNGQDVPNSNTEVGLAGSVSRSVAAWNFLIPLASGEYAELAWYSSENSMRLAALPSGTNPTHPATPSVIVTVVPV
jgi:hypothetical protein